MQQKACIYIKGKVQGVFFRASTKDKANELGINGFVENWEDGGVYIEAEGDEEAKKKFIEWCHIGPLNAEVEDVKVQYRNTTGYNSFQIRY